MITLFSTDKKMYHIVSKKGWDRKSHPLWNMTKFQVETRCGSSQVVLKEHAYVYSTDTKCHHLEDGSWKLGNYKICTLCVRNIKK